MKYIDDLRGGLVACIEKHGALLVGEDIADPYGGAFKVTRGLSKSHPAQVLATPMSEQGMTGLGVGYALAGRCCVVEIMFGDFLTLCADQLINHAAKLYDLYGKALRLVVRTPMGGYRGYGATHSQSLEKMFLGVPGLEVLAPSILAPPGALLEGAAASGVPTLFIENKLDYGRELFNEADAGIFTLLRQGPFAALGVTGEQPAVTLFTYGGLCGMAITAAHELMMEEELPVQVIALQDLNAGISDALPLVQSERWVFLEEGWPQHGVGAGFFAGAPAGVRTRTLGAKPHSIYSGGRLEAEVLPAEGEVRAAILALAEVAYG